MWQDNGKLEAGTDPWSDPWKMSYRNRLFVDTDPKYLRI